VDIYDSNGVACLGGVPLQLNIGRIGL
jgi:hypothetical protein